MSLWIQSKGLCINVQWNLPPRDSISKQDLEELARGLDKQFLLWEHQFGVLPRETTLRFEYIKDRPIDSARDWAWSERSRIFFSEPFVQLLKANNKSQLLYQILYHELAHQFVYTYSPYIGDHVFLHETFAYWVTKDYERIVGDINNHNVDSYYVKSSLDYLLDHRSSLDKDKRQIIYISRLLSELNKRNKLNRSSSEGIENSLLQFYRELFAVNVKSKSQLGINKLIEILGNEPIESIGGKSAFGFQIVDGADQFPLKTLGKIAERRDIGSTLKPVLVANFQTFRKVRKSKNHFSWICGQDSKGQLGSQNWNWQQALVKSCNGYFVDQQKWSKSNSDEFLAYLAKLGINEEPEQVSLGQVVGLVPGIKLSVQELAGIYRALLKEHPEILEVLKETAKTGTLAGLPDSSWFVKNEIALKSGTVRNNSNQPLLGWIVAAKGQRDKGLAWVAVYYQQLKSPAEMLGGLRQWLGDFVDYHSESTKVQVLGLAESNQISLGCPHNKNSIRLGSLKIGDRFNCGVYPVEVTFPLKDRTLKTRKYFGSFRKLNRGDDQIVYAKSTPKQIKARRGSSLVLETGMSSYVSQVLASEMPNGREELLKALALVIKKNALSHPRHRLGPCDTTHCQVFASDWESISETHQSRILKATLAVNKNNLTNRLASESADSSWFPFSNGGFTEWSQLSAKVDVLHKVEVKDFDQIKIEGKRIIFLKSDDPVQESDCEKIRTIMHLQSCPSEALVTDGMIRWVGTGEGHGMGLRLFEADARAASGENYQEILRFFYPGVEIL